MQLLSGCMDFDLFLEGGYPSGLITGVYGPGGSGKTTLAMLAALGQLKKGKKVFFFDTEQGFSVERFQQLGGNRKNMEYLFLLPIKSFEEQYEKIKELGKMKHFRDIGLIIVDTISRFYRVALKENSSSNSEMATQFKILSHIAREHDIPVLVINQVYALLDRKGVGVVGGHMVENWCKWLIHLEKGKKRKALLIKPMNKEFLFEIVENGIKKLV